MTDQTDLKPPPEHAHLRWHWLVPHNDYDKEQSREDPEVCVWIPFRNRDHCDLDYWKTSTGTIRPEGAAYLGWRYHGPCDPAAIIPDPTNEAMVECVMNVLRSQNAESSDPVMIRKVVRLYAHRVLTALAKLGAAP